MNDEVKVEEAKIEQLTIEPKDAEKIAEEEATAEGAEQEGSSNLNPAKSVEEEKSRRVYIGNLSWRVNWQDLKDHMRSAGEVTRADIMTGPDGRSKGCGIVEYSSVEEAQKAVLTLNDTDLNGRPIFVREDREERGSRTSNKFSSDASAQSRRVYVGNLSWDVAWQDLKDHMRQVGEVTHAEVITEVTGRSKGCGIVEYEKPDDAKLAIEKLSETELKGRMIFVREDRETSSHAGPGGSSRGTAVGGQTSVYVWNLAYDTSWQDLKDHCRAAGNVDQATILSGPDGRSNGCGVVVYQHPKEAARAIRELQNTELNGRPIYLREDRSQSGRGGGAGRGGGRGPGRGRGGRGSRGGNAHPSGKTTTPGCQVFVSNLSFETSWQDLKDHFRQIGEIAHADVKESADGQSKGFGTVRFNDPADALKAITELNGVELKGRALEVRLDQRAG